MGKVIASYEVKVVIREPDDVAAAPRHAEAVDLTVVPTVKELEAYIEGSIRAATAGLEVNATGERTDK